jgi:hypothetical protein
MVASCFVAVAKGIEELALEARAGVIEGPGNEADKGAEEADEIAEGTTEERFE